MTYVVAGVSGNTGAVVADTLLAQGKSVRVLVRDRAKGEAYAARGAEVAVADLSDPAALARGLAGAEAAFLLVPPGQTADYPAYQRQVVDALRSAIAESKIPHVVLLSSIGAQHPSGTGPIAGLHYAETQLGTLSTTRFSFLRAAYFMENLGGSLGMLEQGLLGSFFPASFAFDQVATVDIGKAAASLLVEGTAGNQVVHLSGGKFSMNDAATALSRLLGKPIQVAEAPLAEMAKTLAGFGIPPTVAALYQEMTGAIIEGRVAFEAGPRQLKGSTGIEAVVAKLLGRS